MTDAATAPTSPAMDWATRIVPSAFLVAMLVFGGATKDAQLLHAGLQVLACAALAWWAWTADWRALPTAARPLLILAGVFLLVSTAQLIPIPASIWPALPGRSVIAEGFAAINAPLPSLPLSLTPDATRDSLFALAPPLAGFLLVLTWGSKSRSVILAWTIIAFATLSVLLGIAQLIGGPTSPFYIFEQQARNAPVGFFANVNHQGSFLAMGLPFVAALTRQTLSNDRGTTQQIGKLIVLGVAAAVLLLGIIFAGSWAGLGLGAIALMASIFIAFPPRSVPLLARVGGVIAVLAAFAALIVVSTVSPVGADLSGTGSGLGDAAEPLTRAGMYQGTVAAGIAYFPFGTGLGSFVDVYPMWESGAVTGGSYTSRAHSDILQMFLELGLAGVILVAAAIIWWAWTSWRVWTSPSDNTHSLARAATLALGIVIAHSFVDYPLRTPGVAALAAAFAALMLSGQRPSKTRATAKAKVQVI
jgi:O-antigen ligase